MLHRDGAKNVFSVSKNQMDMKKKDQKGGERITPISGDIIKDCGQGLILLNIRKIIQKSIKPHHVNGGKNK